MTAEETQNFSVPENAPRWNGRSTGRRRQVTSEEVLRCQREMTTLNRG